MLKSSYIIVYELVSLSGNPTMSTYSRLVLSNDGIQRILYMGIYNARSNNRTNRYLNKWPPDFLDLALLQAGRSNNPGLKL